MVATTTIETHLSKAVFELLEDAEHSDKSFIEACKVVDKYTVIFGVYNRQQSKYNKFYCRRQQERQENTPAYVRKCIIAGVKVNPADTEIYQAYKEELKNMANPTGPFGSPSGQRFKSTNNEDPLNSLGFDSTLPNVSFGGATPNSRGTSAAARTGGTALNAGSPPTFAIAADEQVSLADQYMLKALSDPTMNWPGVRMVAYAAQGLVCCHFWASGQLDFQDIFVHESGMNCYVETVTPFDESATAYYGNFWWSQGATHTAMAAMQDVLDDCNEVIKKERIKVDKRVVISFREPVVPGFVNHDGSSGGQVHWRQDKDGRFVCSFFLRTKSSTNNGPAKASYASQHSNVQQDPATLEREQLRRELDRREQEAQREREEMRREAAEREARIRRDAEEIHARKMAEKDAENAARAAEMEARMESRMEEMMARMGMNQQPQYAQQQQQQQQQYTQQQYTQQQQQQQQEPVPDGAYSRAQDDELDAASVLGSMLGGGVQNFFAQGRALLDDGL
jgi:hypothetical protein